MTGDSQVVDLGVEGFVDRSTALSRNQSIKEVPVRDALALLDSEWESYRQSARAAAAVRRWRAAGSIPNTTDVDTLLAAMQDRHDPDSRDRLVYCLAVVSGVDRDACRVVLQTVRPGLGRIAQRYAAWWGWEDTASMTVAAALERIVTYPAVRVARPAANIVGDVQNCLYRARQRDLTFESQAGSRALADELDCIAAVTNRSPSDELIEVVRDAIDTVRLSHEEASLIVGQRVLGIPTDALAAARGQQPCTIRLHRRRAEQRLALITRSTDGLHPAVA